MMVEKLRNLHFREQQLIPLRFGAKPGIRIMHLQPLLVQSKWLLRELTDPSTTSSVLVDDFRKEIRAA